jgi:mRNA interferase MazF
MKVTGVVLADALKSLDWRARNARYLDTAPRDVLDVVRKRIALLLSIETP